MNKILAIGIVGSVLVLGGVEVNDALTFSGVPAESVQSKEISTTKEDISIDQKDGIVEAKMLLKADQELTLKYDMNPDASERVSDKMNRQIEVNQIQAKTNLDGGGAEMSITLLSEPVSNSFDFQIEGFENFDFIYQPPLWQEVGFKTPQANCTETDCSAIKGIPSDHRPEEIVGSYVAYPKDYSVLKNDLSQPDRFRVLRPKAVDANGNFIWGTLSYSSGVFTESFDSDWLHNAVYPVKI